MTEIPTFPQMVKDFLKNEEASAFVIDLCAAAHMWDDLIDRDKTVSETDIRDAFRTLLVVLPANPFYRKHFNDLHPLLDASIVSWLTANKFEASKGVEKLRLAYVIRSDYINVLLKCAALLHGFEYSVRIAPAIRAWWHAEGWTGYVDALREQQQGA